MYIKDEKQFNKNMNNKMKDTVKLMRNNPNNAKEHIEKYSEFVTEQYTKNGLNLVKYLKRYNYLKYREGYTKTIILGIIGATIIILSQEFLFPFVDTFSKIDFAEFVTSNNILLKIIPILVSLIFFAIFITLLVLGGYFIVGVFDRNLYGTYYNNYDEILIQIELKILQDFLLESYNIKV